MTTVLKAVLDADQWEQINITFYCFPDDWKPDESGQPLANLYPDLVQRDEARRASRALKRAIDLLGSVTALILLAPALLVAAIAIKLSSPGPVLDRKSTRLNSSHSQISYAVFCLKKKKNQHTSPDRYHQHRIEHQMEQLGQRE